jgi:hypothetical protein
MSASDGITLRRALHRFDQEVNRDIEKAKVPVAPGRKKLDSSAPNLSPKGV